MGRKTYQIEYCKLPDDFGALFEDSLIKICDAQARGNAESTVIHELIHAVDVAKDIGLTETQVLKLESGLVNLFRASGWKIKI